MKKRNLPFLFLLNLVTFDIYAIYCLLTTNSSLEKMGTKTLNGILAFIPIVNVYWFYVMKKNFYEITKESPEPLFPLVGFFALSATILPAIILITDPTYQFLPWWPLYLVYTAFLATGEQYTINSYLKKQITA